MQPLVRIACLAAAALVGLVAVAVLGVGVLAARSPQQAMLVVVRDDGLYRVRAGTRDARIPRTRGARAPTWAPSGRELAFERNGVVYAANRDGSGVRVVLLGTDPDWSPDGRLVAASRNGAIVVATRNGGRARSLTSGPGDAAPAWSPDGTRIAFARSDVIMVARASGAGAVAVGNGSEPAWSPDSSRLAFASTGGIASVAAAGGDLQLHTIDPAHRSPTFSLDGSEIVFASGGALFAVSVGGGPARELGVGTAADLAVVPARRELLPDLDQRAPSQLVVSFTRGRYRVGFMSAVDSVGAGPLWVRGVRRGHTMDATQLVRIVGGGTETHKRAGTLRYTSSPTHSHWHLMNFQRYELRRAADFALLVRDRKTGFCLGDHYGHARGVRPVAAFFVGNCGNGNRALRRLDQGSSRGYTDRYYPHIHGQDLDVTGVPSGVYVVVHRANPYRLLRERRYDNNAASVRIRLVRNRSAPPTIRVLRSCESTERC